MNPIHTMTLLGCALLTLNPARAAETAVYCDGANDRGDIQAAIDASAEGDIVQLHGTCIFDGQRLVIDRSHLTLRGDAQDTDGDGFTDQWNTVLAGNGENNDLLGGPYTNMGLYIGQVPASDGDIVGVTVEGLELRDFYQALTISPGALAEDNLHCDEMQVTGAKAVQTRILNNRFVNNSNHFWLNGGAENTLFSGNQAEGGGGIPLAAATFALGKRSICLEDPASGETSSIAIGTSDNLKIVGNRFYGVGAVTGNANVELVNATNSRIEHNDFTGDFVSVFLFGAINTRVQNNVILDAVIDAVEMINAQENQVSKNVMLGSGYSGVWTLNLPGFVPVVQTLGLPQARDNQILCNAVADSGDPAIVIIDNEGQISRNRFENNPLDVLLLAPGNDVVVGPDDSWFDATGENDVAVTGKASRCAPDLG